MERLSPQGQSQNLPEGYDDTNPPDLSADQPMKVLRGWMTWSDLADRLGLSPSPFPGVRLSPEAATFCIRESLAEVLQRAIEIANRQFSVVGSPVVELEQDPELGESYLVLEIQVKGAVRENVAAHKRFAADWTGAVMWPQSGQIRLVYNLI